MWDSGYAGLVDEWDSGYAGLVDEWDSGYAGLVDVWGQWICRAVGDRDMRGWWNCGPVDMQVCGTVGQWTCTIGGCARAVIQIWWTCGT